MNTKSSRGQSGYGQVSSHGMSNSSPGSQFSNRKNTASGYSQVTVGGGNSTSISSSITNKRGTEFSTEKNPGTGMCKK
jgi:hypothetical protein